MAIMDRIKNKLSTAKESVSGFVGTMKEKLFPAERASEAHKIIGVGVVSLIIGIGFTFIKTIVVALLKSTMEILKNSLYISGSLLVIYGLCKLIPNLHEHAKKMEDYFGKRGKDFCYNQAENIQFITEKLNKLNAPIVAAAKSQNGPSGATNNAEQQQPHHVESLARSNGVNVPGIYPAV
ncbi:hypothetical protein [Rickettsiales endosymbiont of Stachyamoeba lipophora]|uniref:hypothetical protein n=1 Tax=Rickettsiales endosymbiont of Stachyamoeba lipophora TaxID=2486578 RepID=UPI000F655898|nr:hypothetical protein [Rickettsiales endosymbiont of Stachyamoeba lipophora]AZL14983.1 hypothetical protein EF513_00155 [Rickettsiales endosymbiont of Stachyamoeba lipophora]